MSAVAKGAASPAASSSKGRLQPAKLGILLFITVEAMFFAGLISAFLVFRVGSTQWPPEGQPRFPIHITSFNTFFLILSGFTMQWAFQSLKRSRSSQFLMGLIMTACLGILFLGIQGSEWLRLLKFGLSVHNSIYGGFFYALVGMHGLHVLGGLTALLWVVWRAKNGAYDSQRFLGVEVCRLYWFFVVALWPLLFTLVYF